MRKLAIAFASTAILLAGCNDSEDVQTNVNDVSMHIVEVDILTPKQLNPQEPILLEAQVTQGGEVVNDADDVTFEVWESGLREQGVMLEATLTEDGKYSVEHTFEKEGVFFMFAHTNARGLHIMPKQQVVVGNPDLSNVLPDDSSDSMEHMEDHHNEVNK